MVRPVLLTAMLLACAGPTRAEGIDWRPAGGALFVSSASERAPASPKIQSPNLSAPDRIPPLDQPYRDLVAAAAGEVGLDPKLLHAMIVVESAYRARAVSPTGAGGLTQLMPDTARRLGVQDVFDPAQNLAAGATYLAAQIRRFGDLRLALAAYNAGPGRVAALGHVPDFHETRDYVSSVIECYLALTVGRGVRAARDCRAQGGTP